MTPTPAPAQPTAQHHFNLLAFLQILAVLAPAIASPFVKNAHSQEVLSTESQVLAAALNALAQTPPASASTPAGVA